VTAYEAQPTWTFTGALTDTSEVKCPECKEWSPLSEWREGTVGCEDCGDHATMECPRCDEGFDHVWSPTFECRATAQKGQGE
jgi:hypothetical protein